MKEELKGTLNGEQGTLHYGVKHILVKISLMLPYPREYEYRIQASSLGTAINRAIRKMRKEPEIKGKRIKEVKVKAIKL